MATVKKGAKIVLYAEDSAQLETVADKAGKLVVKPAAEAQLIKIWHMKAELDAFVEKIKQYIIEAGRRITPDFKGIRGERVKAYIRASGLRYSYDKAKQKDLADFLKESVTLRVDSDKVDEYKTKHKKLPEGIIENERKESLIVSIEDEEQIILP